MRRTLVLILLLALAVPAIAVAGQAPSGDGTLSVRNGDGVVVLQGFRGVVIGVVGQGVLRIEDAKDEGCDSFNVWGAEREFEKSRLKGREFAFVTMCIFAGKDIRFRLVAPQTTLRMEGNDISLSAVGRGTAFLKGKGGDDGTYSVNSSEYQSLPDEGRRFLLGPQPLPLATE